ncbi:unnamed protein product [Prorocentrum cordatum]|uniref:Uncharacterized protein n=1 Tax=Prorocentrum cordatum TaxID=2364126 RepID=A0ABN9VUI6_9DINO|nr:unnamed protein product [Polarella glacialis]
MVLVEGCAHYSQLQLWRSGSLMQGLAYFSSDLKRETTLEHKFAGSIHRYHDGTPMLVKFGAHQSSLIRSARYLKYVEATPDKQGYWTTQSYEQYKAEHPRSSPSMGVTQVFGQSAVVNSIQFRADAQAEGWEEASSTSEPQKFIVPPMLLADGRATTVYDAVEMAYSSSFDIAGIKAMSEYAEVLIVDDVPDNCNVNKRVKAATADAFKDNPTILYDLFSGCVGHKLHGICTKTVKEDKLVGHVHAVETVKRVQGRREMLLRALRELVDEELLVHPGAPPAEFVEHSRNIVNMTLRRDVDFVRSRREDHEGKRGCTVLENIPGFLAIANGDPRCPRCSRWCQGCCLDESGVFSRDAAVSNVVAAFVQVGIFGGMLNVIPAAGRWHTCGRALAVQTYGILFFNILPRAWRKAFGEKEVPRDLGHSEDYHKIIKSKSFRATLWLNAPDTPVKSAVTTVLTAFVDGLLQTMQHVEENSSDTDESKATPLLLTLFNENNPILKCLREYHSILENPLDSHVAVILRHFEPRGLDYVHICMRCIASVSLALAGQVWRCIYSVLGEYPYRLILRTQGDRETTRRETDALYHKCECCLDDHFTKKARAIGGTADGFLRHVGLRAAIRSWAATARLTNMCTERLLSTVRRASPLRSHADRVVSAGFLSLIQAAHRAAGGNDINVCYRRNLLAAGAPICAARRRRREVDRSRRQRAAGDFVMWANKKMKAERLRLGQRRLGDREAHRRRLERLRKECDDLKVRLAVLGEQPEEKHDLAVLYSEKIGTNLWNCSSVDTLLREDVIQAECERAAPSHPGMLGGLTERLSQVRSQFSADTFARLKENDTIPTNKKFKVHVPCGLMHPGVCRQDLTPDVVRANSELALNLFREESGALVAVEALYSDRGPVVLHAVKMFSEGEHGVVLARVVRTELEFAPFRIDFGEHCEGYMMGPAFLRQLWSGGAPIEVSLIVFEDGDAVKWPEGHRIEADADDAMQAYEAEFLAEYLASHKGKKNLDPNATPDSDYDGEIGAIDSLLQQKKKLMARRGSAFRLGLNLMELPQQFHLMEQPIHFHLMGFHLMVQVPRLLEFHLAMVKFHLMDQLTQFHLRAFQMGLHLVAPRLLEFHWVKFYLMDQLLQFHLMGQLMQFHLRAFQMGLHLVAPRLLKFHWMKFYLMDQLLQFHLMGQLMHFHLMPKAAAKAKVLVGGWEVLSVPGGAIHFNPLLGKLNAHCSRHSHVGFKCKCDRTIITKHRSSGRPLGLLMAWLQLHMHIPAEKERLRQEAAHEERVAGRKIFVDRLPELSPDELDLAHRILRAERAENPLLDMGGEPKFSP